MYLYLPDMLRRLADLGLQTQCGKRRVRDVARPKTFTHQLVVRVDEATYERLAIAATDDGRTPTQLARWLITRWLDENNY